MYFTTNCSFLFTVTSAWGFSPKVLLWTCLIFLEIWLLFVLQLEIIYQWLFGQLIKIRSILPWPNLALSYDVRNIQLFLVLYSRDVWNFTKGRNFTRIIHSDYQLNYWLLSWLCMITLIHSVKAKQFLSVGAEDRFLTQYFAKNLFTLTRNIHKKSNHG